MRSCEYSFEFDDELSANGELLQLARVVKVLLVDSTAQFAFSELPGLCACVRACVQPRNMDSVMQLQL